MNFLTLTRTCLRPFTRQILRSTTPVLNENLACSFGTSSVLAEKQTRLKRPTSAFHRFRQDFADKVRSENPDLKNRDVGKILSDQWANLDGNVKEYYRKEFQQELEEFKAPLKKLPRKPPRDFSLFFKENFAKVREENKDMPHPDILRELGARWRNLSWLEKEEIRRKSEVAIKEYEARIVEFENQLSDEEKDFLNLQAKDKMKEIHQKKLKLLNFPKKPGPAFIFFLNMERESFPREEGEGVTEWARRMAEKWRGMGDDEKEMYRMAWRRANDKYQEDVAEWKGKHESK